MAHLRGVQKRTEAGHSRHRRRGGLLQLASFTNQISLGLRAGLAGRSSRSRPAVRRTMGTISMPTSRSRPTTGRAMSGCAGSSSTTAPSTRCRTAPAAFPAASIPWRPRRSSSPLRATGGSFRTSTSTTPASTGVAHEALPGQHRLARIPPPSGPPARAAIRGHRRLAHRRRRRRPRADRGSPRVGQAPSAHRANHAHPGSPAQHRPTVDHRRALRAGDRRRSASDPGPRRNQGRELGVARAAVPQLAHCTRACAQRRRGGCALIG